MFKPYIQLTKPGIIRGNLLTGAAGFFLASQSDVDLWLFLATLGGIALVIASACVLNNYIDRDIDKLMTRTKKRAIPAGLVGKQGALVYASALGVCGFLLLATMTNLLTVALGIAAMFFYVVVYGFVKRRSVHGTLLGTIPGALPPVAGYTAVTGRIDAAAILLFVTLVFWQMPHFYSIAIFRMKEYKAANIPVLPIKKGLESTKVEMLIYMLGFILVFPMFTFYGYASYIFLIVMSLTTLRWLQMMIKGFNTKDDVAWARSMFGFSLVVLAMFSLFISLDSLLS